MTTHYIADPMKKALFIFLFINTNIFAQYKLVLFSYDHSWIPGWSPHTFALFYSETKQDEIDQQFTISWLPATGPGDVKVFGASVKGKNYSLLETLKYARTNGKKMMMSQVYDIKKELFQIAQNHFNELNSGSIEYKVINVSRTPPVTYHCVYAISDLLKSPKLMSNGFSHTVSSMNKIKNHFKNFITSAHTMSHNKMKSLGISKYKILNIKNNI